jgi:hypothetical protein
MMNKVEAEAAPRAQRALVVAFNVRGNAENTVVFDVHFHAAARGTERTNGGCLSQFPRAGPSSGHLIRHGAGRTRFHALAAKIAIKNAPVARIYPCIVPHIGESERAGSDYFVTNLDASQAGYTQILIVLD